MLRSLGALALGATILGVLTTGTATLLDLPEPKQWFWAGPVFVGIALVWAVLNPSRKEAG